MAYTVNCSLAMKATSVINKDADEVPSAGAHSVAHSAFDFSMALHSASDPAISKKHAGEQGNGSIDLTALVDEDLGTQDMSGLKLQVLVLHNSADNSNTLTVSDPANPYSLNGTKDLVVAPGERLVRYYPDTLADVAAGAKAITFTIAGGETVELLMLFG